MRYVATHIDFDDTDADVLMKADDLCGVGDEAVGELRDVDESVLMNTDVDEGSEVGDVRHDTGEFHSYDEVGEGMDILVEFEDFNLSTWIAPRLLKFGEDVAEGTSPNPSERRGVPMRSQEGKDFFNLSPSFSEPFPALPLSFRRGGWGVSTF